MADKLYPFILPLLDTIDIMYIINYHYAKNRKESSVKRAGSVNRSYRILEALSRLT